jgi:hypothetical protein
MEFTGSRAQHSLLDARIAADEQVGNIVSSVLAARNAECCDQETRWDGLKLLNFTLAATVLQNETEAHFSRR